MNTMTKVMAGLMMTFWAGAVLAADVKQDFKVMGWTCNHCSGKTISVVKKLDGVKDATADTDAGLLTVTFDDAKVKPEAIKDAIKGAGYSCTIKSKGEGKS